MFGPDQEDYLRFAFANAEASKMESLVDRLMESQG
jgi:aspartate/methionine/tyrosine aminotransferase